MTEGRTRFLADAARLAAITVAAFAIGAGINLLRPKPLPLVYEPPARRLAREAAAAGGGELKGAALDVRMISAAELRGVLGREDVAIYEGGWEEWSALEPGAASP